MERERCLRKLGDATQAVALPAAEATLRASPKRLRAHVDLGRVDFVARDDDGDEDGDSTLRHVPVWEQTSG